MTGKEMFARNLIVTGAVVRLRDQRHEASVAKASRQEVAAHLRRAANASAGMWLSLAGVIATYAILIYLLWSGS